jgi:hypothetical protein
MAQTQKVQGTATKVTHGANGNVAVVYHRTTVAERNIRNGQTCIKLNSGGWKTVTTKRHINQFANEFCGGAFNVYQKAGDWFVQKGDEVIPFVDGIEFTI